MAGPNMSADDRFFDADLALRTVQLVLETILRNATTRSCVFIFCTISLWNDAQAAVYQLCQKSSASATGFSGPIIKLYTMMESLLKEKAQVEFSTLNRKCESGELADSRRLLSAYKDAWESWNLATGDASISTLLAEVNDLILRQAELGGATPLVQGGISFMPVSQKAGHIWFNAFRPLLQGPLMSHLLQALDEYRLAPENFNPSFFIPLRAVVNTMKPFESDSISDAHQLDFYSSEMAFYRDAFETPLSNNVCGYFTQLTGSLCKLAQNNSGNNNGELPLEKLIWELKREHDMLTGDWQLALPELTAAKILRRSLDILNAEPVYQVAIKPALGEMIGRGHFGYLNQIYQLLTKLDAAGGGGRMVDLLDAFGEYVAGEVRQNVDGPFEILPGDPSEESLTVLFVAELKSLHGKTLNRLVELAFLGDERFQAVIDRVFKAVINEGFDEEVVNSNNLNNQDQPPPPKPVKAARLLAKFLDLKMTKEAHRLALLPGGPFLLPTCIEEAVEAALDPAFKYLANRGHFWARYRAALVRRLIHQFSAWAGSLPESMNCGGSLQLSAEKLMSESSNSVFEHEEKWLEVFKAGRPSDSLLALETEKCLRLVTAFKVSQRISGGFADYLCERAAQGVHVPRTDMAVSLVNQNDWPLVIDNHHLQMINFKLPPIFQPSVAAFEHYLVGRGLGEVRLSWLHEHSRVEMIFRLEDRCTCASSAYTREYHLKMSMHQAAVLLAFDEDDLLTYEQIQEETGLVDNRLKRVLVSLVQEQLLLLGSADKLLSPEELKGQWANVIGKGAFFMINEKYRKSTLRPITLVAEEAEEEEVVE